MVVSLNLIVTLFGQGGGMFIKSSRVIHLKIEKKSLI